MDQLKSQVKPFEISKWEVKEAWEEVRANRGAPGVDGQSIDEFEKYLKGQGPLHDRRLSGFIR